MATATIGARRPSASKRPAKRAPFDIIVKTGLSVELAEWLSEEAARAGETEAGTLRRAVVALRTAMRREAALERDLFETGAY